MKLRLITAALSLLATNAMAADQCQENFKAEGNLLTGKTYKTSAVIAGVQQDAAFARVLAHTAANDFTVITSDKASGVISAAQSAMYAKGKTVPLGIILQPDAGNLKISMTASTGGGMFTPEGTIRKHFCATIAAAADGASPAPAANNTGIVPPPNPAAAVKAQGPSMPGFASATAAQRQAYKDEVPKLATGDKVKAMVREAGPEISAYIEKVACLADYKALSAMDVFGAPGIRLGSMMGGVRPMRTMSYHDKSQCLSVKRVHGWKAPANNALQFEVVYTADDSGETGKLTHEAVRQPDGSWLFTQ